ncbi:guanylate kinase [archaeon]|nr:guanylate kinase [archaeon]
MPKLNKPTPTFIISGPSGAGEDSVIAALKKRISFSKCVTTITRNRRPGEKHGRDYYFITDATFKKMITTKAFIEWARVYGCYRGCTKKEYNKVAKQGSPILFKVDWQGVKKYKKVLPHCVAIMISPPSYKALEKRLLKRGQDSVETINKRAAETKAWLKHKNLYNHVIVNQDGQLKTTVDRVEKIIRKHLDQV